MKNRVFCSAFGISADEKKIWGSAYDFNEIYEFDLLSRRIKSLGQLEDEENTFDLVESIEYAQDKIIFIPGNNGRYFHILDIKTGVQTKIKKSSFLNELEAVHANRFFSFVWNNRVYVVCRERLAIYYYDLYNNNFKIAFRYDEHNLFHCRSFSLWNDSVAFLSIELNEIVIYNLDKNEMERIKLDDKMAGVNRIAIMEDRIVLYRIEDRRIYLMDRGGVLIKEFTILSETGNHIMAFSAEEQIYLIGVTNWAVEIFKINKNGEFVKSEWSTVKNLDAYCLNRVDDDLYFFEFIVYAKDAPSLNYNAQRCFKYRLGTSVIETIEWETDGIEYERQLLNMLKQGTALVENSGYELEFLIKNIDANNHPGKIDESGITVGAKIYDRC